MKRLKIALAGNPNSGKSTVFNALTGARQHVANYPGVTVEKKYGEVEYKGCNILVVDLPGIYSLTAYSIEEIVARDFILNEKPDFVVDIVDASNLERNLYLTVQLLEMGAPVIIALNMMDLASSRGMIIDHEKLSEFMEIPVVPMIARSNKGIDKLLDTIVELGCESKKEWKPLVISYGMDIDDAIREIEELIKDSNIVKRYPARWLAIKYIEQDPQILELLKKDPQLFEKMQRIYERLQNHVFNTLDEDPEAIIADHRYGYIAGITRKVVKRKVEERLNLSDKIDKVLTNRILGPILMLFVIYFAYKFTFRVSEAPTQWLENIFSYMKQLACLFLPDGILRSLVVSGIIDGVGSVVGFGPLIMVMFFFIAILEDSGYMARIAYMMDRVLRWFGLHGNSILALIVSGGISGGCAVPGVFATRTLRGEKERIATILITPFMNCGAKLPVYAMLIGAFFYKDKARILLLLTLMSWGFSLIAAKLLRVTVLKGPSSPFVMELPPYRLPTVKGLAIHTWERTWQYLKKAGTIILGFSVLMWALMTFPGLSKKDLQSFETKRSSIFNELLKADSSKRWIKSVADIEELDTLYARYLQLMEKGDKIAIEEMKKSRFFPLIEGAYYLENGLDKSRFKSLPYELKKVAQAYVEFRKKIQLLKKEKELVKINKTFAGYFAKKMEYITKPLGFDYRVNIALIGGFAAKEVILSTLATAYSIGSEKEGLSLSDRLRNDASWDKGKAFALMVFIMLYVPCMATVASIVKETSWRWAIFSICFNLLFAYTISFAILNLSRLL